MINRRRNHINANDGNNSSANNTLEHGAYAYKDDDDKKRMNIHMVKKLALTAFVSIIGFFFFCPFMKSSSLSLTSGTDTGAGAGTDDNLYRIITSDLDKVWPTSVDATKLDNDPRPLLIMNVGIPKTGSTTLQHYLEIDNENGVLDHSNYTFFTCATDEEAEEQVLINIWNQKGRNKSSWKVFKECFDKARATGKNAIYSYEIFGKLLMDDELHMENLRYFLRDWKVVIVVTYRRLFDWLPSYLFQNYRFFTKWALGTGVYRPKPFPRFLEYCRSRGSIYSRDWGRILDDVHPTEATLKQFEKYFDNIVIFNIHETKKYGHNLVSYFYCTIMPHALDACEYRKKEGLEESKNVGTTFNYDLLVEAAHNEGLLNRNLRKGKILKAIRSHQENDLNLKYYDFPLICPSPKMEDWLLQLSLEFERRILPKWFASEEGEQGHRDMFDRALERRKFCTIDESEAIQDQEWRNFLVSSDVGNKK